MVKFQNPAVYVEEFLSTKQEGEDGVRHYLSRLKGISNRCEFTVTCTSSKDSADECGAKVSYADELTKFKLVSGLSDADIKEDALGLEVSTLEEIVKAVEVKESTKKANRTLGRGKLGKVSKLAIRKSCFGCGSKEHSHTYEDRKRKCPNFTK